MNRFFILLIATLHPLICSVPIFAAPSQALIEAIIEVESSGRPYVESEDGCRGLGQIKRETWVWISEMMGVGWSFDEAFDPKKNRKVTVFYLNWLEKYLKKKGHYSLELLCASYNAGPGAIRRHGFRVPPYPETRHYVHKVKKRLGASV